MKKIFNPMKFNEKYRISSARLEGWDYSWPGSYFITICIKDKKCFFGKIINQKMNLSGIGKIVKEEWLNIEQIRTHIHLGNYVIMPNHLHGIFIIYEDKNIRPNVETFCQNVSPYQKINDKNEKDQMSKISPPSNSISTAIRFFKRQTTIRIKKLEPNFSWQPRFYDHIIRNEDSYQKISEYITYNPTTWVKDEFFKANSF